MIANLSENIHGGIMKYLDRGIIYIHIDKNTKAEEMERIKKVYSDKVVVFLRSGNQNMNTTISNLLKASL